VAEKGQLLLQLVECSLLEHEFRDFLEAWATASSAVDDELKWSYLALSWICLVFFIAFSICVAPEY